MKKSQIKAPLLYGVRHFLIKTMTDRVWAALL